MNMRNIKVFEMKMSLVRLTTQDAAIIDSVSDILDGAAARRNGVTYT